MLWKVGEGLCRGGQRQTSTRDRRDSMWRGLQETKGLTACNSAHGNALELSLCSGRALQVGRREEGRLPAW